MKRPYPATLSESSDWGIGVRCIGWDGKEYTLVICTNAHIESAAHARRLALNSLRKRGELPPVIKNVVARRFSDLGIPLMPRRGPEFCKRVKF